MELLHAGTQRQQQRICPTESQRGKYVVESECVALWIEKRVTRKSNLRRFKKKGYLGRLLGSPIDCLESERTRHGKEKGTRSSRGQNQRQNHAMQLSTAITLWWLEVTSLDPTMGLRVPLSLFPLKKRILAPQPKRMLDLCNRGFKFLAWGD